jgi:hypothetical protein
MNGDVLIAHTKWRATTDYLAMVYGDLIKYEFFSTCPLKLCTFDIKTSILGTYDSKHTKPRILLG